MTRALVLRHHPEDHSGLIGEAFEIARLRDRPADDERGRATTPSLDGYDVFVILGSKSAVYDKEVEQAWFGREVELIADARASRYPRLRHLFRRPGALPLSRGRRRAFERTRDRLVRGRGAQRFGHRERSVVRVPLRSLPAARERANCGRRHRARCRPSASDATSACSSIPRSITCSCGTGSRAASRRRASSGVDVDALIEQTERETPAARERAADLVDLFLAHIER